MSVNLDCVYRFSTMQLLKIAGAAHNSVKATVFKVFLKFQNII